jgi:glycosyltransferase involved in cell wall biosynthesis
VGDGPERAKLHGVVQANKLERHVVFLGPVKDVRLTLLAMDIFVLTSASETFSNAALEAMAMEKPVVLSTVGGATEMVFEGVNGYLYQSGNVTELVTILHRLIVDDETRQNMGRMARSVVAERFTLARMVDAYEDLAT